MDGGDQVTAPSSERVRSSSWGGPEARAELRRIADEARLRSGFEVASFEVLRRDGFLEEVAACGRPEEQHAFMGRSYSLPLAMRVLREGTGYGAFAFLREEDMAPDLQEAIRGYGYVPVLPETDDPRRWRSLDMLTAHLTDDSGRTRALFHLDEPVDGLRPAPARLAEIAVDLELLLQAAVTTADREELTRHARLDETAREVVRAASLRLDRRELLDVVNPRLVAGFRATGVQVHLYDDPADEEVGAPPADLLAALGAAARRAWDSRTVIVVEPGHVWGDDDLDGEHRVGLRRYVEERAAQELLVVPVGAGHEAMGMLLVVRDARDRWTEIESVAALGVGHDVGRALLSTRSHEREQQLIGELQRLDEYRRQLIATVAHELKNPLGVIAGHVELLEQLPDIPAAAARSLRALTRSTSRLDILVRDLLLLSRIGNPDTPLARVPVDLRAVLAAVTEDEALRADQHHLTVRTAASDDDDVWVAGDPGELLQLVANLVNNAMKYSHDGGPVDLALRRDGDRVVFTCTDRGLGMSGADREQLFGEFFRSPDPEARERPGSGLGLAIVARIVARHEGRIEVESTLGHGSTFTVTLPAAVR